MSFVSEWTLVHRHACVVFSPAVLELFRSFRQHDRGNEAGGLLLGRRRGSHLEVVTATAPLPGDIATPTRFVRQRDGHQALATAAWSSSHGEVDYVGEWHSHSERCPHPSRIDLEAWKLIARQRPLFPMLGVIVGTEQLYVAQMPLAEHDNALVYEAWSATRIRGG